MLSKIKKEKSCQRAHPPHESAAANMAEEHRRSAVKMKFILDGVCSKVLKRIVNASDEMPVPPSSLLYLPILELCGETVGFRPAK